MHNHKWYVEYTDEKKTKTYRGPYRFKFTAKTRMFLAQMNQPFVNYKLAKR